MYYPIRSYDFPSLCGDKLVRLNKKNSELVKSLNNGIRSFIEIWRMCKLTSTWGYQLRPHCDPIQLLLNLLL